MKQLTCIRALGAADSVDYLALRELAVQDPGYGVAPGIEQSITPQLIAQSLEPDASSLFYGALQDKVLVGMTGLGGNATGQATLFGLYVRPECRRQSIASRLVDRVIESASGSGYELLRLTVLRANPGAINLYAALGFIALHEDKETLTMVLPLN